MKINRDEREQWNRAQAERGALILHRLVPAPDHGRGFRRDPETGFVFYSSEWLSDERDEICGPKLPGESDEHAYWRNRREAEKDIP